MSAVPSGLPLLLDKMSDEDFRQKVISDWVSACPAPMLAECVPALRAANFKDAMNSIFDQDRDKTDLFCFSRFLLALFIAKSLGRKISSADVVYAVLSDLPESAKLPRIRTVLGIGSTWDELRTTGFPLFVFNAQELLHVCSCLSRSAHAALIALPPEEKLSARTKSEQALFWAVVAGCSPRGVLAWKREFDWSENAKLLELLSSDWTQASVRETALKAAIGHKTKSEFLFAAVLFIWLDDIKTACRDCLFRGMGDWQLALFVADLRAQDPVWDEIWQDLFVELSEKKADPWAGISLVHRFQRRKGLASFERVREMLDLQSAGSPRRLHDSSPSRRLKSPAVISTPATPALQELDIILSRKGFFRTQ